MARERRVRDFLRNVLRAPRSRSTPRAVRRSYDGATVQSFPAAKGLREGDAAAMEARPPEGSQAAASGRGRGSAAKDADALVTEDRTRSIGPSTLTARTDRRRDPVPHRGVARILPIRAVVPGPGVVAWGAGDGWSGATPSGGGPLETRSTLRGPGWGRRLPGPAPRQAAAAPLLALQRSAGNAAVSALVAGKLRSSSKQASCRHRSGAAGDPSRRTGDRYGREGPQGGQGCRRAGRSRGHEAAGIGPGGDHDRVRTGIGAAQEAGAPGQDGPRQQQARQGRRETCHGRRGRPGAQPTKPPAASAAVAVAGRRSRATRRRQERSSRRYRRRVDGRRTTRRSPRSSGPSRTSPRRSARTRPRPRRRRRRRTPPLRPERRLGRRRPRPPRPTRWTRSKPGSFDKKAFIAAVKAAIAAKAPKNLDEADKFASSGKADSVKGEVMGKVTQGKEGRPRTSRPPPRRRRTSRRRCRSRSCRCRGAAGPKPCRSPAAGAMPQAGAGRADSTSEPGKRETDPEMAEADVTEEQLAKSNEPEFKDALAGEEGAARHTRRPRRRRFGRPSSRPSRRATAGADRDGPPRASSRGCRARKAPRRPRWPPTRARRSRRTSRRGPRSPTKIKAIFDATKTDVEEDPRRPRHVRWTRAFEAGEKARQGCVHRRPQARMERYKEDRYGGGPAGLRWPRDLFTGLPAEGQRDLPRGRKKLYRSKMEVVISDVADHHRQGADRAPRTGSRRAARRSPTTSSSQPKELQKVGPRGRRRDRRPSSTSSSRDVDVQAGGPRRRPRDEVRRGPQRGRRGDQGAAGGEPGPVGQGQGRHRRRDPDDPAS